RMHQASFRGEDASDRPERSAVAPSLLRLIWEQPPSGRYRAADFPAAMVGTATEVASNGMATQFASNGTAAKPVRVEAARWRRSRCGSPSRRPIWGPAATSGGHR